MYQLEQPINAAWSWSPDFPSDVKGGERYLIWVCTHLKAVVEFHWLEGESG